MKKQLILCIALLIISINSFSEVKIGIYGFSNNPLLNKIAESYLSKKENITLIDRENIDLIISEKKLELYGIVESDENAAEFTELDNIDYLFIGKELENSAYIKIIDKRGKVIYSQILKGNIEKSLKKELSSLKLIIFEEKIIKFSRKDALDSKVKTFTTKPTLKLNSPTNNSTNIKIGGKYYK